VLPPTASVGNPVDIVGDADAARYGNALRAAGPESADAAVVVLTAQATTESLGVARAIVGATRSWPIPVMASFVGGARVAAGARAVEEAGIPCYAFPEHAVAALGRMALLASRRSRARGEARRADPPAGLASLLTSLESRGGKMLGMGELGPLLDAYGIPMARAELASSVEEAAEAAVRIGFPVAVKIASPDITHKTDVGGVRLGCRSREGVAEAAGAMLSAVRDAQPSAAVDGFLVQRMLRPGHELLLGMICDEQFGPLVMVGFGGIYVEVLKDTAARLAALSPAEALKMLDELRMASVLGGIRGRPAANRQALADMVSRFSRLAVDVPGLLELELNPVVADEEGSTAVDARGMVAQRI
jgi:acetyltransferase